jgi:hypothetical protein
VNKAVEFQESRDRKIMVPPASPVADETVVKQSAFHFLVEIFYQLVQSGPDAEFYFRVGLNTGKNVGTVDHQQFNGIILPENKFQRILTRTAFPEEIKRMRFLVLATAAVIPDFKQSFA